MHTTAYPVFTVPELLGCGLTDGRAILTGTITGIMQRTNRAGAQYALLDLTDGDGHHALVWVFPRFWNALPDRALVTIGTDVAVVGVISGFGFQTELIGQHITLAPTR
ncbi:hypothetical protein [Kitasatospora viridis]|uniref:OB-fold nucleic acid binding protein n=1 Tax=Kitasatospora viridis TaxID=281105 RepID=A0A561UDT7_9ACTN|nr:hypothetical protein [Kitasatospora viridis]TWF97516.1 hypothetical protein FHX73_111297 [Kitasatospora viridis]